MKKTTRKSRDPQKTAVARLRAKYKSLKSWAKVGGEIGANKGMVNAIANGKKKAPPSVLRALGLPVETIVKARVCSECGTAHVKEVRCPKRPRRYRDLWDWPTAKLAAAFRNRAVV